VNKGDQTNTEEVEVRDQKFIVEYIPKEQIAPAFGYAMQKENKAFVREDLPLSIKRFVRSHELYHLQDQPNRGGWIWSEVRANLIPGLRDPIGLIETIIATLTKERLRFYLDRFKKGCYKTAYM